MFSVSYSLITTGSLSCFLAHVHTINICKILNVVIHVGNYKNGMFYYSNDAIQITQFLSSHWHWYPKFSRRCCHRAPAAPGKYQPKESIFLWGTLRNRGADCGDLDSADCGVDQGCTSVDNLLDNSVIASHLYGVLSLQKVSYRCTTSSGFLM